MRTEACSYWGLGDKLYVPGALGAGECYRLSSRNCTPKCDRNFDSPAIRWFLMDTSIVTWIAYCISNNRGSTSQSMNNGLGRHDGEIKFHQDKPEGDTLGRPQSHAPSGLARFATRWGSDA